MITLANSPRVVKLITHLHLCRGQRMRGAIPPLLQYVMMWCLFMYSDNFSFLSANSLASVDVYVLHL
jgi:hypothetical protein